MSTIPGPRLSLKAIQASEESHLPTSFINVSQVERWVSTIGGTLIVTQGLRRGTFGGLGLALLGGSLIYRGVTGHCHAYQALNIDTSEKHRADASEHIHQGHLIKEMTTINRSANDLYAYWRDVELAPTFMSNIQSVKKIDETHSQWVSSGPFGKTFQWNSEIINDQSGRLIAWKSLPGGDISAAGTVRFEPATNGKETVVTLEVSFEPPAGILGLTVAKMLGEDPQRHTRENLRQFKQLMETGELPTTTGQSSGRAASRMIVTPSLD